MEVGSGVEGKSLGSAGILLPARPPVDRPVVLNTPPVIRVSSIAGPRTDCGGDRLCCPTLRHSIARSPLTRVKDEGCIFIAMGNQGFPLES